MTGPSCLDVHRGRFHDTSDVIVLKSSGPRILV